MYIEVGTHFGFGIFDNMSYYLACSKFMRDKSGAEFNMTMKPHSKLSRFFYLVQILLLLQPT